RSGSTIAAGLSRGLDRDAAPRFSFLMLIPAVTAAALMEVPKLTASEVVGAPAMALGFVTALVTGYLAVGATLRVVRRDRLRWFAVYCWLLGAVSLVLMLLLPDA
ncbi:MAG: undecaprenyl-diphosphatase, partial [Armatimonadetes bacterium]|nr:undecaprenyl-diphosphatase [Armatimonadota bacterium]